MNISEINQRNLSLLDVNQLKAFLDIFKGVSNPKAKVVIKDLSRELGTRKTEAVEEASVKDIIKAVKGAAKKIGGIIDKVFDDKGFQDAYAKYVDNPKDKNRLKKIQDYTNGMLDDMSEESDLEEAVKFWTVTITKKAGKLFKGQTVDVKARNSAEAIKKGIKQMKGNPMTVPSGSVDAVLGEATDLEENIGVKDGRRVVVKALTKPAALRLKKKLRNKFSSWDTSIDKDGLSMIVPNEKPIVRYLQKQPEVDTIGESTDLEEAALPFKELEKAWIRTKGNDKKREKLIKKHKLKPLISNVRQGAIKLGPMNNLKMKDGNHTMAGLDAEGELIFISNNPTRIHYPSNTKDRPKGAEMKEDTMVHQRLVRVVEVALGERPENTNEFIKGSNIDLTMTPSSIQKSYKQFNIKK